jgi:hypothetical protein
MTDHSLVVTDAMTEAALRVWYGEEIWLVRKRGKFLPFVEQDARLTEAIYAALAVADDARYRVECESCDFEGPWRWSADNAIAAWNRRASPDDAAALAEARARIAALERVLKLALEYWAHRQQRYKNRHPVWVQQARAAIAQSSGGEVSDGSRCAGEAP